MEEAEYRKMFEYEDTHWWFRGKRSVVAGVLARWGPARRACRSLDVGCGTGANLELLGRYGEAHGVDVSPLALAFCRRRGLRNLACASAAGLPYRDRSFDVVAILDVLYHRRVSDVCASLREAYRVCRPGGLVVITDAAFEALRGPHDVAYHGARRFRRRELARAVAESGFTVVKCSYLNALLFPLAAAVRLLERGRLGASRPGSSLRRPRPAMNRVLEWVYGLEARLLPHADLPFGLSVLVVGAKAPAPAGADHPPAALGLPPGTPPP